MTTVVPTHRVTLWMAGDLATAHRVLREHAYAEGACVTVTPTKFIYSGGEEDGFSVGLVNYPRYPTTPEDLEAEAEQLALKLLPACNQKSCLLVGDTETKWIVIEPPKRRRQGTP